MGFRKNNARPFNGAQLRASKKEKEKAMKFVGTISDRQGLLATSKPIEAESEKEASKRLLDSLVKQEPMAFLLLLSGEVRLEIRVDDSQSLSN